MRTAVTLRRSAAVLAVSATLATGAAVPAGAADDRRLARTPATELASQRRSERAERAVADRARAAGAERVALTVRLTRGASADAVVSAARGSGATVRQRIPQLGAVTIDVPAVAATRVAEALRRRGDVRDVAPVRQRRVHAVPNDPAWATAQSSYLSQVNAPAAWDVTHGSADVLIAVVDSGVDVNHPDLSAKIAGAYNAVTGTADVTDTVGHGTFVAGVAAASTNNGIGVAGAGHDASVLAVKVAADDETIAVDDEVAGIVWAADNGAHVVNISLGGDVPDPLEADAVAYAQAQGALVVASAGNDATDAESYPAAYDGVLAVGATNGTSRASFSNHGSWVDLGAPGVNLRSTAPTVATAMFDAGYDASSGTSFSAPLVAGQAALLFAADPDATAGTVGNAIASTTTGSAATYGFAAGRVDFAAALATLAPTTSPVFTEPGLTDVSGDLAVAATSTAPSVRFSIEGGPSRVVDVVDGTASATLETYGLSGTRTLSAADCNDAGCNPAPTTLDVTVDNGTPTVTSPAQDAVVRTNTLSLTATAPVGGGVRFLVDGTSRGFDGEAPYAASIPTASLAEGAHTVTAVVCNRAGTVCDSANPSAAVGFNVSVLHPSIPSINPARFSPNGDGRYDWATITYVLDVAQSTQLYIKNSAGTVVRGPGSMSGTAGSHTWAWNGRNNAGAFVPDGTYTVAIATSREDQTGFASRTVVVDRSSPNLSGVTGAGGTFYPYRDGYHDTFRPSIVTSEAARLSLRVYNPAGTRIRVINAGPYAAGRHALTWDGKTSSGAIAPAGTYYFDWVVTDLVSNARVTGRYVVYVSGRRLVARVAERVVTPDATRYDVYVGACSRGTVPALNGRWTGSHGYYSDFYCNSGGSIDGFVATDHAFTLPAAVKYGNVQIGAVGREAVAGYGDWALLSYLSRTGDTTDYDGELRAAYGTYWGPLVGSSSLLDGRTVRWWAGTGGGNWYEVQSFKVRWQYFVLS